jgi:GNAT superfamily N-acetyltransferase
MTCGPSRCPSSSASVTQPLTLDSPELVPAMEANYRAFWETLDASPLITVERRPEGMRFTTGIPHPVFNGIMNSRLPGDDAAVQAEIDYFAGRGLPMSWTIGPSDTPADLCERLERLGASHTSTNPGMLADLGDVREEALPPAFEIVQVSDEEDFRTFSRVLSEGFGLPVFDEFARMFIDTGDRGGAIASFLGFLNGEPVATSRAILANGLAGIYTVATRESARGKGIGRAITLGACLYGKHSGYRLATLQASDMGHAVYQRMGFWDVCEFRDYTWTGAQA